MFRQTRDESFEDRGYTKNDQNMMGEDDRPLVEEKKDHFHFLFTRQRTWSQMLNQALSDILKVFSSQFIFSLLFQSAIVKEYL